MYRYVRLVPAGLLIVLCLVLASCVTLVMNSPDQGNSAPVINIFEANPSDITVSTASMIRWDVSNATSITIDQNIGSVTPSGSTSVAPSMTTTYTLTATNALGSVTATTQVRVSGMPSPSISTALPIINSFTAMPPSISSGSSSMLSWNVTNATSVNISPAIGAVSAAGNAYVSPGITTNYTLTASNAGGAATATVQVAISAMSPTTITVDLPVIHTFTANPTNIAPGESTTLNWSVSNANSVTISPSEWRQLEFDTSGSVSAYPSATTSYTLTAINNWGMRSRTITVMVYSSQPAVSEPLNWSGTWHSTEWDTMYLTQTGYQVTGTYDYQGGRIVGQVSKNGAVLYGTWSEEPSYAPPNDAGDVELTMSPDFNSFTGKWRYGSEGEWDGTWSGERVIPKVALWE